MGKFKLPEAHIETLRASVESVGAETRAAIKRNAQAQARCPLTRFRYDVVRAGFFLSSDGIVSVASGVAYKRFNDFICAEVYKKFGTNEETGINDRHIESVVYHLVSEDDFNAV